MFAVSIPEIGVGLTGHLWPFHRPDRRLCDTSPGSVTFYGSALRLTHCTFSRQAVPYLPILMRKRHR